MKKEAVNELQTLRKKHGILNPRTVVDFARDENTHLHSYFDWDDAEAGEKYRLIQARQIIRVVVSVEPSIQKEVRVFVSLTPDRHAEGGYRSMSNVIADSELRRILLRDAIRELITFQNKYRTLNELAGVFDAIRKLDTVSMAERAYEEGAAAAS